ncbi:RHS repeat protein [Pontibacter sp. SGAir0037]|uniref:RHS repeat protein n=1 Tax=Pontibacter sp. SGAir0037 TaxID=2571030 RepID=UPI00143D04B1|nr:RHS repeat domain-containing protein [Pontibacter sp. SGAir0037]
MGKFGNVPVGLSTGIPRVSVPIYSYSGAANGLSLSVSLDYHAGGVKVDEVASSVGIGWALSAGGVVSRVMRGIPDEVLTYGFMDYTPPQVEQEGNVPFDISARPYNLIYTNTYDSQGDLFSYSFGGRSGKFSYGRQGDLLIHNLDQLKIEKTMTGTGMSRRINSFTITDDNGYKYVFGAAEQTFDQSYHTVLGDYTSSWYLTEIVTPSGKDKIVLEYESTQIGPYNLGPSASEVIGIFPRGSRETSVGGGTLIVSGKRLKHIRFPDGVEMSYSYKAESRTDLVGDRLLDKITITDAGGARRGFRLVQDYSTNRATLRQVIPFSGASETESKPYAFEYHWRPLPDRMSWMKDHWGYHNSNTGHLIPEEIYPYNDIPTKNYKLAGGNRDTDPERVKAGSLTKMSYPTGGYTVFELEANQAQDNWLDQSFTYTVQQPPYTDKNTSVYLSSGSSAVAQVSFSGQPNTTTNFEFEIPGYGSCPYGGCSVVAEIRAPGASYTQYIQKVIPYSGDGNTINYTFYLLNMVQGTHTVTFYTTGGLQFENYVQVKWREVNAGTSSTVTLRHLQPWVGGLRAKKISDYDGISTTPARVREYAYVLEDGVTSSGALGAYPTYTHRVHYAWRSLNGPENPSNPYEIYLGNFSPNSIVRSSSPVFDIAYGLGSPVTYRRVVERETQGGQDNGRTESHFTSFADHPPSYNSTFPYTPPIINESQLGLLKRELVYSRENALLKETVNEYQFSKDESYHQNAVRMERFRSISLVPVKYRFYGHDPVVEGGVSNSDPERDYWKYQDKDPIYFIKSDFYPVTGRTDLVKSTVQEYSRQGTSTVSYKTETRHEYDAATRFLRRSSFVGSRGETQSRELKYPQDLVASTGGASGVYGQMVAANILRPVVEERQTVAEGQDVRHLVTVRTNYHRPFAGQGVFVPQTVETQSLGNGPEVRLRYHGYDDRGKPKTVSKEGDVQLTYIWGYNHSLPVAQVENASYEAVRDALGGEAAVSLIASSATLTAAQQAQLNGLRSQLPQAQVTTYTYSPSAGVTSVTDARGQSTHYEYDGMGRLRLIRDHRQNILKAFCYSYAGELISCDTP